MGSIATSFLEDPARQQRRISKQAPCAAGPAIHLDPTPGVLTYAIFSCQIGSSRKSSVRRTRASRVRPIILLRAALAFGVGSYRGAGA